MIKIEFNKARAKPNQLDLTVEISNETAKGVAELLTKELKDVKCEKHPNQTSIISVTTTPLKKNMFEVKKKSFCCKEFKDSINIDF